VSNNQNIGRRSLLTGLAGLPFVACAPTEIPAGPTVRDPELQPDAFLTADGWRLPVRHWPASKNRARGVVLAVHGFGDYSAAFEQPAQVWAQSGLDTWSWDQRGFGGSPTRGHWAGVDTMVDDLCTMARLLRARRPGLPLAAVGESMGGAVLLAALGAAGARSKPIGSAVLAAPAARAPRNEGPLTRSTIDVAAHLLPWVQVGSVGRDRPATDSSAALERMRKDPLMLASPRVDLVYGMVNLMEAARAAAPNVRRPILLLYGQEDRVMPAHVTHELVAQLPDRPKPRLALYENGHHLLFRDRQGDVVARDVAAWIADRRAPLPSGAERTEQAFLKDV
jgi:acylglycerol lipase